MKTECTPVKIEFQTLGSRQVVGQFNGGEITSDGGGLLLREVENQLGIIGCFTEICFCTGQSYSLSIPQVLLML